MFYVLMYLGAIVGANLIVNHYGPDASIMTAFLFIGLDLTARDKLHDAWRHNRLVAKMAALIVTGSTLTVLVNWGAWRIALASTAAFAVAATVDGLVYHKLIKRHRWLRVNGSNLPSSAADSLAFPILAFGWPPMWGLCAGQFVAKVAGGLVWMSIFEAVRFVARKDKTNDV